MRLVVILSLVSCLMGCNASVSGSLGDLDVSFRDAMWYEVPDFDLFVVLLTSEMNPCSKAVTSRQWHRDNPSPTPQERAEHEAATFSAPRWTLAIVGPSLSGEHPNDGVYYEQDTDWDEGYASFETTYVSQNLDEDFWENGDGEDYFQLWFDADDSAFELDDRGSDDVLYGSGYVDYDEDDGNASSGMIDFRMRASRCTELEALNAE